MNPETLTSIYLMLNHFIHLYMYSAKNCGNLSGRMNIFEEKFSSTTQECNNIPLTYFCLPYRVTTCTPPLHLLSSNMHISRPIIYYLLRREP